MLMEEKMSKKRWCKLLLCVVAIIILCVWLGKRKNEISFSAVINRQLTEELSKSQLLTIEKISLKLKLSPGTEKVSGTIQLITEKGSEDVAINGYLYKSASAKGYVGVLDGKMKDGTLVTVDVNYVSSKDNLTAVTIGTAGNAGIYFFGNESEGIQRLQNEIDALR